MESRLCSLPRHADLDDRWRRRADALARLAVDAGGAILPYFRCGDVETRLKDDGSPVSVADLAANRLILEGLGSLEADIPIISEESPEPTGQGSSGAIFFVDPLDGSRDFLRGNAGFTVNIALVIDQKPVCGVVYAPALKRLFIAATPDYAWEYEATPTPYWRRLRVRSPDPAGWVVAESYSHRSRRLDRFLEAIPQGERIAIGSSIKFCLIAAAEADLYLRLGRTMHWDTAAGHAIIQAAGGAVVALPEGNELTYRHVATTEEARANPAFIAYGHPPRNNPMIAQILAADPE